MKASGHRSYIDYQTGHGAGDLLTGFGKYF